MKKSTRVNHPPTVDVPAGNTPVVAPIYQTVKFEFETVDDTLRSLSGERPGFFYLRSSNPDHASAGADARRAAGSRGLPGMRVRGRRDRADAAGADAPGRSCAVLPGKLRPDAPLDTPYAGALRRVAHAAADRGPRCHRAHAVGACHPVGDFREPDQSHQQDCRYRRDHAPGTRPRRHDAARQYLRRCASARPVRHRFLPAQPDQIRLRTRRCHGRGGDRQGRADQHLAPGFLDARRCA